MHDFVRELYPLCRSITGEGLRITLSAAGRRLEGFEVRSVPSGTRVNDWEVPDEWNIRDAFVADVHGDRVIDFKRHNLHVVNYSTPVRRRVTRDELIEHVHTLPDRPGLIPYRTTYYDRTWGFCLEHERLPELTEPEYDVVIDATLEPGELNYGELVVPGAMEREVLISTHVCHPSLANDNLSGVALAVWLAQYVLGLEGRRYTYRFLFIPGTIGAITWLSLNPAAISRTLGGLVVALVGAPGPFHYKATSVGDARIDRVVRRTLGTRGAEFVERPFHPYGYDERQYNSPGYRLPIGSLTRTPHGEFPEYHTSADNLDLVKAETLGESLDVFTEIVRRFESERVVRSRYPFGEPQLGRRGLYDRLGGAGATDRRMAMLWVLNQADGDHSVDDIAERSGLSREAIDAAATILADAGVVTEV